jgi:hypothetical protein
MTAILTCKGTNYLDILGTNCVELWHSQANVVESGGVGTGVTSWVGFKKGITLGNVSANKPAYATDGSNFKSKSIISFTKASINGLANTTTLSTPVGNTTDTGSLIVIGRDRQLMSANDDTHNGGSQAFSASRWLLANGSTGNASLATLDTNTYTGQTHGIAYDVGDNQGFHLLTSLPYDSGATPHFFDGSVNLSNSSRLDLQMDGTSVATNAGGNTIGQINKFEVGCGSYAGGYYRGASWNIALVAWCSVGITPAQRTAIRALSRAEWGTP